MVKYLTRNLKQKAVVWKSKRLNNIGEYDVQSPIEISCRWEDVEKQTVDEQGNPVLYTAEIFVGCDIPNGSILWLGRIVDKPADSQLTLLREVIGISKTPNRKGNKFEVFVMARNYKNNLPTLV